jgi:hypothetical protein
MGSTNNCAVNQHFDQKMCKQIFVPTTLGLNAASSTKTSQLVVSPEMKWNSKSNHFTDDDKEEEEEEAEIFLLLLLLRIFIKEIGWQEIGGYGEKWEIFLCMENKSSSSNRSGE